MRNIWTIANREYKLFFASPLAYLVAFIIMLVLGIFFYINIQAAALQQFAPGVQITLAPLSTLLMLATPAITTRLLAEENGRGTIELLLTAPVRDWELVVGKWLGGFLFMLTLIAVTIVYPLILNQLIDPGIDQGPVISGYLGVILLAAALVALGTAISAMFNSQIWAFAATIGLLIFLWWIIAPIAQVGGPTAANAELVRYLDFSGHFYDNMLRGIIDLSDLVYYLSITALALMLGTATIEMRRWR